ncbi:30420_t:CDS:2 [Racocetra persica]|uniref:30420_t:CDS:1 n=1 Tax=Racocetra persica TaxID=160502 RepID=A0ACA9LLX8_9GLOM|nr:30420_t:CDS:2 [Racocetra persica]
MVEIVKSKEILRNSINLIWKATGRKVVTVTFNNQLRLATISLDNGTNVTVNLERIVDNKNVSKYQLYNKSVSDNSEYDQNIDKLINVVSEMFNQSKNSMQADDVENVCQLNNKRININNQKKRREKEISETFVSQDPTKIFEMYSQPVNKYFNKASISSLEPELLLMLMKDINSCTSYLRI